MLLKKQKWLYISILVLLWLAYFLYRVIDGLQLISDEVFYITQDISLENKRILFLSLAQYFSKVETAQIVIPILNLFAVLISFIYLSKINFYNYTATFFQLIYFSGVATYIFRDSYILMLTILLFYIIFKQKMIINLSLLKKTTVLSLLMFIAIFYLMLYTRPQYAILLTVSWLIASILIKSPIMLIVATLTSCLSLFLLINYNPDLFNIYGISIYDFVASRADRHGVEFTFSNSIVGFFKHFLTPIPTSLISRMMDPTIWNDYGIIDDVYRFIYKSYLYFCLIYIALNFNIIKEVLMRWKFEGFFLLSFSLSNAFVYTLFSFGGGHERTKIFSVFAIFFIYTGIVHIKQQRALVLRK
jgi:hypothetical protein